MHLLLTDRLTCPRCGPEFGLILLAQDVADRRVREGVLGCPNCRDSFLVEAGFADLRAPPRDELEPGLGGRPGDRGTESAEASEGERLIALLGIPRGPGTVALVGSAARHSIRLASTIDDLQVVGVDADLRFWPDASDVSRIVSSPGLPFFTGMLRGVVVDGRLGADVLLEAIRVMARGARLVVTQADAGVVSAVEGAGLGLLARERETVVATRG